MITTIAASLLFTGAAQNERKVPVDQSKIFTFDAGQLGRWNNRFGVDPELEAARKSNKIKKEVPSSRGLFDFVTVSGNFAFTFTVRGPGTTTSAIQTSDISMETNQPLTITTSNFGSILDSGNVARPNAGSVEYEFSILYNGGTVDGPDTGVDASANGFTLNAPNPGNIFTFRTYILRIRRRITITEEGKGAESYTATGRINLTIN